MNEQFVMGIIKKIVNLKNEMKVSDYDMIVRYFNKDEELEFLKILKNNNIKILDEENVHEEIKESKKQKFGEKPLIDSKKISMSNEQLCKLYQKGEKKALDLLWMKNEGLVKTIVNRYSNKYRNILEFEDLEQSCFLGFKKAVEKFDSSKEAKFSTYLVWWLRQSVLRTIADTGTLIRIPVHKWEQVRVVKKYMNEYNFCDIDEIITIINEKEGYDRAVIEEDIILARNLLKPTSLDFLVGEKEDTDYYEVLVDESQKSVEDRVIELDLQEKINELLDGFSDREQIILRMRFGLDNDDPKTLEEIGKVFGVTRERIRQIEAKAIRKLKHPTRIKKLKNFYYE